MGGGLVLWWTVDRVTTEQFMALVYRIFRRFPLKVVLVLTVVCLAVKEEFPFSHFPMYESFSDYSFVVYVADRDGEPIPVQRLTSQKTSKLKKIFNTEQKQVRKELEAAGVKIEGYRFMTREQRRPAGEKTLKWLYKNSKNAGAEELRKHAPLRLYYLHLRVGEGGFERELELIAEVPAPAAKGGGE